MTWVKNILSRNAFAYIMLAVLFTVSLDHAKAQDQRSRYLLGIFYNEHLKNYKDGIVYFDYMARHEPDNPQHRNNLAICTKKLINP